MRKSKAETIIVNGKKYYRFDKKWDQFVYNFGYIMEILVCLTVIGLTIFVTLYIFHYKNVFLENPLVIIAERMNISCQCFAWDVRHSPWTYGYIFYFNSSGIYGGSGIIDYSKIEEFISSFNYTLNSSS